MAVGACWVRQDASRPHPDWNSRSLPDGSQQLRRREHKQPDQAVIVSARGFKSIRNLTNSIFHDDRKAAKLPG